MVTPVGVGHHRFIDLHLIGIRDLAVVRLEARGVGIVVITCDRAIRLEPAGLEDDPAVAVAQRHVEPDAARRIGRWEFVSAAIGDLDFCAHAIAGDIHVADGNPGGFRLEVRNRAVDGRVHFIGLRGDAQVVAKSVEDPLHEEIPADKGVPRKPAAWFAEHGRNGDVFFDARHVAVLAAAGFLVVAVEPFLIRHLLRQFADDLALRVEGRGEQGMAGCAQFRGLDDLLVLPGLKGNR